MLKVKRTVKNLKTLIAWEFDRVNIYLLGFIIFVTTAYVLHPMVSFSTRVIRIGEIMFQIKSWWEEYLFYPGDVINAIEPLVAFLSGILFASNVARTFENREMLTLLTCPIKRFDVILSKFLINFLILYFTCGVPFTLDMLLLGINPLSFDMYIWLLILLLPVLFTCSIALFASVTFKAAAPTAIIPPLAYFGLLKILWSTNVKIFELLYSEWDKELFNAAKSWLHFSSTTFSVNANFLYILLHRLLLPIFS
ncbi:MAG: hypothetical protein ACTSXW_03660 [Candidatus Baldrarchaeia archaeon]